MGMIQLIIIFTVFVIIKNYAWEKEKRKSTIVGTTFEIIVLVLIVLVLEHFFPFLK